MNGEALGQPWTRVELNVTSPEGVEEFLKLGRVDEGTVDEERFHGIAGSWVVTLGIQNWKRK